MSNWPDDECCYSLTNFADEDERVQLKFFSNEKSFRKCLVKNQRYSLPFRILNFVIKVLPSILYVIQVILDDPTSTIGCCHICQNHSSKKHSCEEVNITDVHWNRIIFVNRKNELWICQIVFAILSIVQLLIAGVLAERGKRLSFSFIMDIILELMSSAAFLASIFYPKMLRCLFVPSFLSCWIFKTLFEDIMSDLNRMFQRTPPTLFRRVMKVISSTFCIIFTSICGFQHLQRGGCRHVSLFESLWFVVVTFSTVGYGDYTPDVWLSQAFMIVMIIVSLIVIPIELERLVQLWLEKNKLGGTYSHYRAKREKHVVLCTTCLKSEVIFDFLNEFYAHQKLQDHCVCILTPCEMDNPTKIIIQIPTYAQRVIYIQGSPLSEIDLNRARIQDAKTCFILAPYNYSDSNDADKDTIMRSWAIKDFAPKCPQCVQLYRAENMIHIKFAKHVVCLDEFKNALLGNNIQVPGISSMVTLLIHTSRGQEGQSSAEQWQKLYGQSSGNEVYSSKLKDSKFFKTFDGKSFSQTSYHVYKRYGLNLIAILAEGSEDIKLNPGPKHTMKGDDLCFYLSITDEKNSSVEKGRIVLKDINPQERISLHSLPNGSTRNWPNSTILNCTNSPIFSREQSLDQSQNVDECIIDRPSSVLYVGMGSSRCHLMRDKRSFCCLQLLKPCEHCTNKFANEYPWKCRIVIIYTKTTSDGLFNLIVPLRSHWIRKEDLKPIVILVLREPDKQFLESISQFPLIYWTLGSSEILNDLLKAGILLADSIVVMNDDGKKHANEETLSDCRTIMIVQKIYRFFPGVKIFTEISHSSNIKFILFSPDDECALSLSKFERKERRLGSNLSYMFRLPFAAGNVFSTNMLDALLYQVYIKPNMISFLRIFLGIHQPDGSGYLSSYKIRDEDINLTIYGKLYEKIITKTCKVPIGIYRTNTREMTDPTDYKDQMEISKMINNIISSLKLPSETYRYNERKSFGSSFVIINPQYDLKLQKDDIIYVISPPQLTPNRNTEVFSSYSSVLDSQSSTDTTDVNIQSQNRTQRTPPENRAFRQVFQEDPRHENIPLIPRNSKE